MKRGLGFGAVLVVGGLSAACLTQAPAGGERSSVVSIPWRAGNAQGFQIGTVEEHRARSAQGLLSATIYRPEGPGPSPFVVLMHGCGGLRRPEAWTLLIRPWVDLLLRHGVGTAVVDSFGPRGVDQVCTGNVAGWAVRRADDAYSARRWLTEQPYVDARRIAVMGMSNGGRTVLAALRTTLQHPDRFVAGVALYPGCQSDLDSHFYAPLLVLIGRADTVTPAHFCEQMKRAQPASSPDVRLIVYPGGPHAFDMRLPDRTVLGMRLGYDPQAHADAQRQVIEFLTVQGVVAAEARPARGGDR